MSKVMSEYFIEDNRRKELLYYCKQYPIWVKAYECLFKFSSKKVMLQRCLYAKKIEEIDNSMSEAVISVYHVKNQYTKLIEMVVIKHLTESLNYSDSIKSILSNSSDHICLINDLVSCKKVIPIRRYLDRKMLHQVAIIFLYYLNKIHY